ncbi:MAG: alpha/beta hydrolase [Acidobacteria bacterium]|nr:alpha/beta hydrolase [Acidobacteriota bacterium]
MLNQPVRAAALLAVAAIVSGSGAQAGRTGLAPGQADPQRPDVEDARYGPAPRNLLDLWKAPSPRPTPVIVYFHGGGFVNGGKEVARGSSMLAAALASGVSFASVSYQYLNDSVHLPVPMRDGARAIQFLRARAAEWNLDPARVAAYGVSAGAGISLWIAFHDDLASPASADPIERQSSRLTVVGSINGQVSYDPHVFLNLLGPSPADIAMLAGLHGVSDIDAPGAQRLFDAASPLTYLTRDDPPVFTYYRYELAPAPQGGPAYVHNPKTGAMLKDRMDRLGVECVFRHLADYTKPGGGPAKRQAQEAGDREMLQFFLRHFGLTREPAGGPAAR